MIETVDFSEFEALFQVKRFKKTEKTTKREESKTPHIRQDVLVIQGLV